MNATVTIEQLQQDLPLDRLEQRILLGYALGLSRVELITQSKRAVSADEARRFAGLLKRRLAGEPIAYILGQREFYGLSFEVTPAVLIPRPETELLVELALGRLPGRGSLLDMGTGSGAIAVAVACTRHDVSVSALDLSPEALTVATRNAATHKVQIRFLQSDWYGALAEERYDLIVANPPYIAGGDSHLAQGDLRFEPASALTDHADGLSALRRIACGAKQHLKAGGWLIMEHGYNQAAAVRDLLTAAGLGEVQSWPDLAGIERVSGALLPVSVSE